MVIQALTSGCSQTTLALASASAFRPSVLPFSHSRCNRSISSLVDVFVIFSNIMIQSSFVAYVVIQMPDLDGVAEDIVLGYDSADGYRHNGPYLGVVSSSSVL